MKISIFYIYFCIGLINCDKEDWLDPGDMLRYDPGSKTMRPLPVKFNTDSKTQFKEAEVREVSLQNQEISLINKNRETSQPIECKSNDSEHMKRFVNQLLKLFQYEPLNDFINEDATASEDVTFNLEVHVKKEDIATLMKFVKSNQQHPTLNDIDDILTRFFHSATPLQTSSEPNFSFSNYGDHLNLLLNENTILIGCGFLALVISIYLLHHLTLLGLVLVTVIVATVISVAMEYILLTQEAQAEQMYRQRQFDGIPKECQPSQLAWYENIGRFFKSSVFGYEDNCKAYFKTMVVNPKFEITPAMAFTSMVGKIGVTISGLTGRSLSTFYDKLVEGKSLLGMIIFLPFTIALIWATLPPVLLAVTSYLVRPGKNKHRLMVEDIPSETSKAITNSSLKSRKPITDECGNSVGLQTHSDSSEETRKIEHNDNQVQQISKSAKTQTTKQITLIYKDGETQTENA